MCFSIFIMLLSICLKLIGILIDIRCLQVNVFLFSTICQSLMC